MTAYTQKHDLSWMAAYCPQFAVSGKNIRLLQEPSEFLQTLKEFSLKSTKRIILSSMYLGVDTQEQELVSSIQESLENSQGNLQVHFLLDYMRCTRDKLNCKSFLLLPLLRKFPCQMKVSLFYTPELRGFARWFIPRRYNEIIGQHHMKICIFDDTLVLSGANLSQLYFTNCQDRYLIFENCRELCDYFHEVVSTVSTMSFLLQSDDSVILHPGWDVHPYKGNYKEFTAKAQKCLESLISSAKFRNKANEAAAFKPDPDGNDTLVYPMLQLYIFGIRQDEKVVERFLHLAESGSCIRLSSGYLNLPDRLADIVVKSSKALYRILVTSPKMSAFFGDPTIAGYMPYLHMHNAMRFFEKVMNYKQQNRVELWEYKRSAWTFHVKGLWYYKPNETLPSVTFIGSPNYNHRSMCKDLESQVAIVTENKELQMQLHDESQRVFEHTGQIDERMMNSQRKAPLIIRLVAFLFRSYL